VKAALIASIPFFSPGSEWLLPIEIDPVTALAGAPLVAGVDGAAAVATGALGAVEAAGEQAAIRLGTLARPATPAIPPSTRRRVRRGLLGDGPFGECGVSGFAMVVLL
jgi:hypothetical protein